ncbi:hypothetical protein [Polyangium spumosum]|uniref:Uncharacterized protein n=1 Tax=Polyangium spumosum TaxID=889282 RepID=A0A6N7PW26_9BACT|nr:hypothetical protein [Polyangium spumosum]MRG94640.1 hypothetical protein [Polyangium spumosum]
MMLLEHTNPIDAMPTGAGIGARAMKQVFVIVAAGALTMPGTGTILAEKVAGLSPMWTEEWTRGSLPTDAHAREATEEDQAALVMELRRRTGLTWEKLGDLFGVDRRSVHFWASGRAMNATNREKLGRILALVRRLPADSQATRAWLLSPDNNARLPFDLLRDGQYDEFVLSGASPIKPFERPKVSPEVLRARAPRPPEELVGALHDSVHRESSKLRAAIPLKKRS